MGIIFRWLTIRQSFSLTILFGLILFPAAQSDAAGKAAELIRPAPGSLLQANAQIFEWSPGENVSQYELYVETISPKGQRIFVKRFTSNASVRIASKAFASGHPVRVKLNSRIDNNWFGIEYTFETILAASQCGDNICQKFEGHDKCPADCPSKNCGNGYCESIMGENGLNCRPDCSTNCGDGVCERNEDHSNCQGDCPSPTCGNKICEASSGEHGLNCQVDCSRGCGDSVCEVNESHTLCQSDCPSETCGNGVCESAQRENGLNCQIDCTKNCGDGACSTDEDHTSCQSDCPSPTCGNGRCEPANNENGLNCQFDCPQHCGDGTCQPDENNFNCPADCFKKWKG